MAGLYPARRASQSGESIMSRRNLFPIVAAFCVFLLGAASARAGLSGWESVSVNHAAADATFSINFGHAPNFTTTDANGRLADSFQILIAADPTGPNPFVFPTTVVRGDEIR